MAEANEAMGGIDVLINSASGFGMGDDEAGWAASPLVDAMATVRVAADPMHQQTLKLIPFAGMGTPREIAHVALFLASPHERWITGQTIAIDGRQLLGV